MILAAKSSMVHNIHRIRGKLSSPFKAIPLKPQWREKLKSEPLPNIRYAIFFTPRSGSSRLTDVIKSAGGLSVPGECFNPNHIRKMAAFFGAQNLGDYVDLLMRQRSTNGTFGCEIISSHLYEIFSDDQRFFELCQPTASIYLIRENIVEQAVSLARMAQTGVDHSLSTTDSTNEKINFHYKPAQIRLKLDNILCMENKWGNIFAARNLSPLRLSYEMLSSIEPRRFVTTIADHIGAVPDQLGQLDSVHEKIGDERNLEFSEQFRKKNTRLLNKIDRQRLDTLNALAETHTLNTPS